jgi:hypothetical protein
MVYVPAAATQRLVWFAMEHTPLKLTISKTGCRKFLPDVAQSGGRDTKRPLMAQSGRWLNDCF